MQASVLAPLPDGVRVVSARHMSGPPSLELSGLPPGRVHLVADRVRAGILNAGLALPAGQVEVDVDPAADDTVAPGLDLPLALAILLAEPSRAFLCQPGLVAWGAVKLDGGLAEPESNPIADLPASPWVGRFWSPVDHVPSVDERAVLSIVDVPDLRTACEVLFGLLMIEKHLAGVAASASNGHDLRMIKS